MTGTHHTTLTPRMKHAIAELKQLVASRSPDATFVVRGGEDREDVCLVATVEVEDVGAVVDLFLDRLVDLQVDENLPISVLPVRPLERNLAILARQRESLAERSSA